jgi:hypothetical protein
LLGYAPLKVGAGIFQIRFLVGRLVPECAARIRKEYRHRQISKRESAELDIQRIGQPYLEERQ